MAKMPKKIKAIWNHFVERNDDNGIRYAYCNHCNFNSNREKAKNNTTGLQNHIRSKHPEIPAESYMDDDNKTTSSQDIRQYIPKRDQTKEAAVGRLIALDGISYYRLSKSIEIRKHLRNIGLNALDSANTVRKWFFIFFLKVVGISKLDIAKLRESGAPMVLIADEWTSMAHKRYLNVNLRVGTKLFNLGLCRIRKGDAYGLYELIVEKLRSFGVKVTDIISFATDGAYVMQKLARIAGRHNQLCYLHGIHLAVSKLFYPENVNEIRAKEAADAKFYANLFSEGATPPATPDGMDQSSFQSRNLTFEQVVTQGNLDRALSGMPTWEEHEGDSCMEMQVVSQEDFLPESFFEFRHDQVRDLIKKVRKAVELINRSPETVQALKESTKNVTTKYALGIGVIGDSKNRWDSLYSMMRRFFKIRKNIDMVLPRVDLKFTEEEYKLMEQFVTVL